mgnify:CR=1 FL=1
MLWNALTIALREIRRNLLRGFLTVLGVVIGVAAVVIMVSLGQGATESVTSQVESLGSNLIMAIPGAGVGPSGGSAPGFRLSDAEEIAASVAGPRNRVADCVITVRTTAPRSIRRRARYAAL